LQIQVKLIERDKQELSVQEIEIFDPIEFNIYHVQGRRLSGFTFSYEDYDFFFSATLSANGQSISNSSSLHVILYLTVFMLQSGWKDYFQYNKVK
jgi:hypothetical protein